MDSTKTIINTIIPDSVRIYNSEPIRIIDYSNPWDNPITIVAFISVAIALLALFSPLILSSISEIIRLRKLKNTISFLLRDMQGSLEQYVNNLENLVKQISNEESKTYNFPSLKETPFYSFQKIEYRDLHSIFLKNIENIDHFRRIVDVSDYLRINNLNKQNFSQFFSDIKRYEHSLKDNVNQILRGYDRYLGEVLKNGIDPNKDPFLNAIKEDFKNWRQKENKDDLNCIISDFLEPIRKTCKQHLKNSLAQSFLNNTINADYALKGQANSPLKSF